MSTDRTTYGGGMVWTFSISGSSIFWRLQRQQRAVVQPHQNGSNSDYRKELALFTHSPSMCFLHWWDLWFMSPDNQKWIAWTNHGYPGVRGGCSSPSLGLLFANGRRWQEENEIPLQTPVKLRGKHEPEGTYITFRRSSRSTGDC